MFKAILRTSLILLTSFTLAQANALEDSLIQGIKFLDDVPEVEWYRVDGSTLIIGWKGIPKFFPHTNRKSAIRGTITIGKKIQVWAVRHNQKKWAVGSGEPFICSVSAKNGRVKSDTCPYR